ncbi:MmgE/PrpD family protein [Paracoccus sp. SM22M-07]|uniref:MmgE/PrpD family protein n=1 Tax=Paracoccus sp. SM22M-07 TaxID=1520813 RepID=UPI0009F9BB2F
MVISCDDPDDNCRSGAISGTDTRAGSAKAQAMDGLGTDWVFPCISYKLHAFCHGLHAMLEAARDLRAGGLVTQDIESIAVVTHPRWLVVCDQPRPATGLQAKFSYRLTAAMALANVDTASLDVYSDATCARDDLRALRDRVTVQPDHTLSDCEARVRVRARGETFEAHHDILGDVNPAGIKPRLRAKAATLLGRQAADDLRAAIDGLGTAEGGLAVLTQRIGKPCTTA